MTNTRITDPEILERRYPCVLRKFHLRSGSGGEGYNKGGDGVIREIEFRLPLTVSILSERRVYSVPGMNGGGNGKEGLNIIHFKSGKYINLGGKNSISLNEGDRIVIHTPGKRVYLSICLSTK